MANHFTRITPISPFPTRQLPQQRFDEAVRTDMSQLGSMVTEINGFIDEYDTALETIESTIQHGEEVSEDVEAKTEELATDVQTVIDKTAEASGYADSAAARQDIVSSGQNATRAEQAANRAVAVAGVDVATTQVAGLVRPDGVSITVEPDGRISSAAIQPATPTSDGVMSAEDKIKLDSLNNYVHPSYTPQIGKPTKNQSPSFGETFDVTQFESDATGHITSTVDYTVTIPNTTATDSAAGLMSAEDKQSLDDLVEEASAGDDFPIGSFTRILDKDLLGEKYLYADGSIILKADYPEYAAKFKSVPFISNKSSNSYKYERHNQAGLGSYATSRSISTYYQIVSPKLAINIVRNTQGTDSSNNNAPFGLKFTSKDQPFLAIVKQDGEIVSVTNTITNGFLNSDDSTLAAMLTFVNDDGYMLFHGYRTIDDMTSIKQYSLLKFTGTSLDVISNGLEIAGTNSRIIGDTYYSVEVSASNIYFSMCDIHTGQKWDKRIQYTDIELPSTVTGSISRDNSPSFLDLDGRVAFVVSFKVSSYIEAIAVFYSDNRGVTWNTKILTTHDYCSYYFNNSSYSITTGQNWIKQEYGSPTVNYKNGYFYICTGQKIYVSSNKGETFNTHTISECIEGNSTNSDVRAITLCSNNKFYIHAYTSIICTSDFENYETVHNWNEDTYSALNQYKNSRAFVGDFYFAYASQSSSRYEKIFNLITKKPVLYLANNYSFCSYTYDPVYNKYFYYFKQSADKLIVRFSESDFSVYYIDYEPTYIIGRTMLYSTSHFYDIYQCDTDTEMRLPLIRDKFVTGSGGVGAEDICSFKNCSQAYSKENTTYGYLDENTIGYDYWAIRVK